MLDERDYFMKNSDPAAGAIGAQADGGDSDGDDVDDARERLIEELAKRTQFTMDELRDRDDEFLQKLIKSIGLDADDLDAVLNARVDAIDAQVSALEGGDGDVGNFHVGGTACGCGCDGDRESETNADDLDDFDVGGAFATAARGD